MYIRFSRRFALQIDRTAKVVFVPEYDVTDLYRGSS